MGRLKQDLGVLHDQRLAVPIVRSCDYGELSTIVHLQHPLRV